MSRGRLFASAGRCPRVCLCAAPVRLFLLTAALATCLALLFAELVAFLAIVALIALP
ncbi:MAG: hypothetical protein ACREQ5_03195 [Candidatus Dormibacteria bacterium]